MVKTKPSSSNSPQLDAWQGGFGNNYVDRNEYADWKIPQGTEAFRRILGHREIDSILEVGSNIGLNLIFLNELFQGKKKLFAVEPNKKAVERLTSQEHVKLAGIWNCDAFQLPLANAEVDLVFSSGVLIHIAPADLGRATDEIVRVARKYVLCIEYFSHQPVEVPYRGHQGLLFKRDFGGFYLDRYPQLRWVDYGFFGQREFPLFDNLNWWLFEKIS